MKLEKWQDGLDKCIENIIKLIEDGDLLMNKGSNAHAYFFYFTALEGLAIADFILARIDQSSPKALEKILNENLSISDFDDESIVQDILNDVTEYSTEARILSSDINNKSRTIKRLARKREYISLVGKIMCDILTSEEDYSATLLAIKYNCSWGFIDKIIKFLEEKDILLEHLKKHFTTPHIKYDDDFKEELFSEIRKYIDELPIPQEKTEDVYNYCVKLYSYAIGKGLSSKTFDRGKNIKSLSLILLFCSLRYNNIMNLDNEYYSKNELFDSLFPENKSSAYDSVLKKFYPYLPSDFGIPYQKLINPSIIELSDIEELIKQRNGKILDSKADFKNKIKRFGTRPSTTPVSVQCSNFHRFYVNYNSLFHHHAWCPICNKDISLIGTYIHPILEYLIFRYLKLLNCKVYIESVIKSNNKKIDIRIKRNDDITCSCVFGKLPYNILEIMIDFTLAKRWDVIRKKFFKYHSENRFLIIVYLTDLDSYDISKLNEERNNVPNGSNIRILSLFKFFDFLDINLDISKWSNLSYEKTKIMKQFHEIIALSKSAIDIDEDLTKLNDLYLKYNLLIKRYRKHKITF